jgi:hypothetical protein
LKCRESYLQEVVLCGKIMPLVTHPVSMLCLETGSRSENEAASFLPDNWTRTDGSNPDPFPKRRSVWMSGVPNVNNGAPTGPFRNSLCRLGRHQITLTPPRSWREKSWVWVSEPMNIMFFGTSISLERVSTVSGLKGALRAMYSMVICG